MPERLPLQQSLHNCSFSFTRAKTLLHAVLEHELSKPRILQRYLSVAVLERSIGIGRQRSRTASIEACLLPISLREFR